MARDTKAVCTVLLQPQHGLAGDMFLGLLVDLGASLSEIERTLQSLQVSGWSLQESVVQRNEMAATRVHVQCAPSDTVRHLSDILSLIDASEMSDAAKRRACKTFEMLGRAEASVHGVDLEAVHFHEVGAVDAIIDICGTCIALEQLGVEQVVCGVLPGGSGTVTCAHGTLSVPVPAVVALCATGFSLQLNQGVGEMVTPTGMALLAANGFPLPDSLRFHPQKVGFGAGTRQTSALRGTLGVADAVNVLESENSEWHVDEITLLSTNVDDISGERLSFVMQEVMRAGALDVSITPCLMKKGRPGHRIEVMARTEQTREMVRLIMRHTSSLGVRILPVQRLCAKRHTWRVDTPYGPISVKVGPYDVKPEYDECVVAARAHQVPLHVVQDAARSAGQRLADGENVDDCSE